MMKNILKKTCIVILTLLFLFLTAQYYIPCVLAYDYQDDSQGYEIVIQDDADLFYEEEIEDIALYIQSKFSDMHYDVLVLTADDAQGKSAQIYLDDYIESVFSGNDTIGFLIDMDNREIAISTDGNAQKCLTDQRIENALSAGYTYIGNDQYYACVTAMISSCASYMSDDPTEVGYEGDASFVDGMINGIIPSVIVTGILVAVLLIKHNKANKAQAATAYVANNDYEVLDKDEIFVRSYETVIKNAYKPSNSSSGGHSGGSTHRSSSGRSHGGGSRKF